MYCLSQQQIDFILNDIGARGVKMESLQLDLLDHICCVIEQNLEEDGDFEAFYAATIKTFYRDRLSEIEDETINLLTFKHYYIMKKIMLISGSLSAILLSAGILFKFLYMVGASALILSGIVTFSLIFLPLVFTLKAREQQHTKDRLIVGLGTLAGILLCMAVLFKVFHWPGANALGVMFIVLTGLVFLPLYFFSGIRHPETKVNTIVGSVIIVAFCGLFLALVRSPHGTRQQNVTDTAQFFRLEQLYQTERSQNAAYLSQPLTDTALQGSQQRIDKLCEQLKQNLVKSETGQAQLSHQFEEENTLLSDGLVENSFNTGTQSGFLRNELKKEAARYNQLLQQAGYSHLQPVMVKHTILETVNERVVTALSDFISIQMVLLQNRRALASANPAL